MKSAPFSVQVPFKSKFLDESGVLSTAWSKFFEGVQALIDPLGIEKYFEIVNNTAVAADVEGLSFEKSKVSQASVDYLIQRVTTGGGAQELIETGTFYAAYRPTSADWVLSGVPSTAGVTLTITSTGQVQYTSSNITGTASISKLTWRARTLAAKNSQYSVAGR